MIFNFAWKLAVCSCLVRLSHCFHTQDHLNRNPERAGHERPLEGRDYLSVKLDDPSFTAPIYANFVADEDSETFTALGDRIKRPRAPAVEPVWRAHAPA